MMQLRPGHTTCRVFFRGGLAMLNPTEPVEYEPRVVDVNEVMHR